MTDTIYVGSAKAIQTQHGGLLKLSFSRDDLQKMLDNTNEAGWVNLAISKRKEPSQYGQTHSCKIDTWKPEQAQTLASNTAKEPQGWPEDDSESIPF